MTYPVVVLMPKYTPSSHMRVNFPHGPPARLLFHKIPSAKDKPCTFPDFPFSRSYAIPSISVRKQVETPNCRNKMCPSPLQQKASLVRYSSETPTAQIASITNRHNNPSQCCASEHPQRPYYRPSRHLSSHLATVTATFAEARLTPTEEPRTRRGRQPDSLANTMRNKLHCLHGLSRKLRATVSHKTRGVGTTRLQSCSAHSTKVLWHLLCRSPYFVCFVQCAGPNTWFLAHSRLCQQNVPHRQQFHTLNFSCRLAKREIFYCEVAFSLVPKWFFWRVFCNNCAVPLSMQSLSPSGLDGRRPRKNARDKTRTKRHNSRGPEQYEQFSYSLRAGHSLTAVGVKNPRDLTPSRRKQLTRRKICLFFDPRSCNRECCTNSTNRRFRYDNTGPLQLPQSSETKKCWRRILEPILHSACMELRTRLTFVLHFVLCGRQQSNQPKLFEHPRADLLLGVVDAFLTGTFIISMSVVAQKKIAIQVCPTRPATHMATHDRSISPTKKTNRKRSS